MNEELASLSLQVPRAFDRQTDPAPLASSAEVGHRIGLQVR